MGLERIDNHEGVSVKALLDSGATGMFADKKFVEKNGFKLEKLDRPVRIRNVDGTGNSGGLVMHETCYDLPWTGLLTSGDAGCHRLTAVGDQQ